MGQYGGGGRHTGSAAGKFLAFPPPAGVHFSLIVLVFIGTIDLHS